VDAVELDVRLTADGVFSGPRPRPPRWATTRGRALTVV
jgi:hypothetical protein